MELVFDCIELTWVCASENLTFFLGVFFPLHLNMTKFSVTVFYRTTLYRVTCIYEQLFICIKL